MKHRAVEMVNKAKIFSVLCHYSLLNCYLNAVMSQYTKEFIQPIFITEILYTLYVHNGDQPRLLYKIQCALFVLHNSYCNQLLCRQAAI
jgi:hypothetical protein